LTRAAGVGALLAALDVVEADEREFLEAFAGLLELPGDVFSADHYVPGHITASGFVVHPSDDAVLLIHHEKLGMWLQPGGHVEPADGDLEAAARREIAEEVGIDRADSLGAFDVDIHTFPARSDVPTHLHYDVRFAFRALDSTIRALDGVVEAVWVPFGRLGSFPVDRSILRPVAKLLNMRG